MNRDLTRRLLAAGPVLGLLLVGLAFGLAEPAFASQHNLVTIAVQTVITAIAALGMTFVIASGGIDLSVGSVIALAGTTVAALLQAGQGAAVATLAGLVAGTAAGLVNGALVTRLSLAPFVVTLATMGAGLPSAMAAKLVNEHEMGELFKVIGLAKGVDFDALGFVQGDRCHRL